MWQSRTPRSVGQSGMKKQLMLRLGVFTPGSRAPLAPAAPKASTARAESSASWRTRMILRCAERGVKTRRLAPDWARRGEPEKWELYRAFGSPVTVLRQRRDTPVTVAGTVARASR